MDTTSDKDVGAAARENSLSIASALGEREGEQCVYTHEDDANKGARMPCSSLVTPQLAVTIPQRRDGRTSGRLARRKPPHAKSQLV